MPQEAEKPAAKLRSLLRREALPLFILLLLALLQISKALALPHCLAFDPRDDAIHTFVNLFAARDILAAGQVPQMNFFNNFGTPLLGDALTHPFALQALPYYFLSGPTAMTLNRFLTAFATLVLLYSFYRQFFSSIPALFGSAFSFYTAGFYWHSAHHHYQATLLFFVAGLIPMVRVATKRMHMKTAAWLIFFAGYLCILSVSANLTALSFPLWVAAWLVLGGGKRKRESIAIGLALLGALAAGLPQIFSFFQGIGGSVRSGVYYGTQYDLSPASVLLGAVAQVGDWKFQRGHLDVAVYFSLPMLAMGIAGAVWLWEKPARRHEARLALFLGLIPMALVYALLCLPDVWWKIPGLRSTDITRVLWLSNVFLGIGAAYFAQRLIRGEITSKGAVILFLPVLSALALIRFLGPWEDFGFLYRAGMLAFAALLGINAVFVSRHAGPARRALFTVFLAGVFFLSLYPTVRLAQGLDQPCQCESGHWFAAPNEAAYHPREILAAMEPGTRVATALSTRAGFDLKAIYGHVLGSNGRSIVLNRQLADYLAHKGLVEIDDRLSGYHFIPPWRPEELRRLGIRYIVTGARAENLDALGWPVPAAAGGLGLYEDPLKPTPFYMESEVPGLPDFLRDYHFDGNRVLVRIPAGKAGTLVATFVARPEFSVMLDGKERLCGHGTEGFLRIPVKPGEREVVIEYAPFGWGTILTFLALGLLLCAISTNFMDSKKN